MILRKQFLAHVAQTSPSPMLVEVARAEGSFFYTPEGKRYFDLVAGVSVSNVGHGNPAVVRAVQEQAARYMHVMVYGELVETPQVEYAARIASLLPAPLESVYFVNSGAEAVEGALKLAKRFTRRTEIVSMRRAYHGSTHGAMSMMGAPEGEEWKGAFRPLLPDVQAASSLYMSQSSETNAQIMELNTQLSMARYIRNYMTASGNRGQLLPANTGLQGGNVEQQISEYNAMQLQRNNLVANSSESNPLVTDMDHSLSALHDAIISSIDNLIVSLNTQIASLERSEAQTTARIAANPGQAKHLLSVERQQKVKEQLYLFLLQKREENELSQAFTAYNTRLITPPTGSMIPTSPVKKNILLVAFAFGILTPIAVIFVRENLNTKVRGRKDLENLSLPFAGEVPLAYGKKDKKKKEEISHTVIIRQNSRNIINEAFRVLRTNLEFMTGSKADGTAPVIIFTSFDPGSGKTFLAINLAASFALKGKKVLGIDCDLRHASLSRYVGSPRKGVSGYLANKDYDLNGLIVEVPDCPGLFVLPAGIIPPNPTELLAEPSFGELMKKVKGEYDYVFIDCPPVEIVADTQLLARVAAPTLFVIRAGLLKRDMLPELQKVYDEKRYKDMAVVLNGTEGDDNRYGYKYGYGKSNYYSTNKD